MKTKNILIAIVIVILLSLHFGLKPYLKKRAAIKTAKEVLNCWTNGNLMDSAIYWEKTPEYPPLYGILSYKITKSSFYKENKDLYAKISAKLEFSSDALYSNVTDWTFVFRRNVTAWKVINFYPSDEEPQEN